jgi:predicted nucleotidyltransferase
MARSITTTSSLTRLFPNPAVLDVLALLMLHPDRQFYQREIATLTQNTVLQAQRALNRIQDAGLVEKNRMGNRVYYIACRDHPAFEDLKRVLIKTVALGDQLRSVLLPLESKVLLSFVYGSVASGAENATSDVDLLLVGDLSSRQAARVFGPLGRELGREFNSVIYPKKEFLNKARSGNQFIKQVLAAPKIWLIGSENELKQLVK